MLNQFRQLFLPLMLLAPTALRAQAGDAVAGWTFAAAVGAGVASVPTSADPVYFDAAQITARLAAQHALGAGFFGGVALVAAIFVTGSDCTLGACAPQIRQHVLNATVTFVHRSTIHRFVPVASIATGVARLPEQWAAGPRSRTPGANALSVSASLDLPVVVRPRTAMLLGWEAGILPNAPGDRVHTNALIFTIRHTRAAR